ncbi:hydroxyisourate hydrolase [Aliagarivorans marinus]|uniref:hydroxyisourate hydrolase n=1 Tax=Aliagarivorans marinus TaxID=561965 RepID=UPI00040E655B|nr:hydroxyisourate hydrolase [Aliagarivorans marinus]
MTVSTATDTKTVDSKRLSSSLSCHVLDTSRGQPAEGIVLEVLHLDAQQPLAEGRTDADGRFRFDGLSLDAGHYTLRFHTADYCEQQFGEAFFPRVDLHFSVNEQRHYHLPLLLSPYAYSSYRGS